MRRWSYAVALLLGGLAAGAWYGSTRLQGQAPATPALPRELTSYRDVVKKVLPAVVSVESKGKARKVGAKGRVPLDDPRIPEEFRRFFEGMPHDDEDSPGPNTRGFGSGLIVDSKGVILTNHHVVDGADQVTIHLNDGRKYVSKEIKSDPKTDLAIVRVAPKEALPFLELGDSSAMEIGDRVLAIGAPFGLTGSVTTGIISAKGRSLKVNMYEDFLQTDAAINPGNSGGPLVNLEGKVVGINSAIKSRSGGWQGVGLAIASNLAKNVMQQLLRDGVVHRGYLGVQISDIADVDVAKKLGLDEAKGVLVTQVFDNAPAGKAGLQGGDVVTALGGKAIKDGRELQTAVAGSPIGKPVEMAIIRDGKRMTLTVTIEEQPQQFGTARRPAIRNGEREPTGVGLDKIGIEVADLTPEMAERLGYKEGAKGAVITKVDPDGVAAEAGLRRGFLITRVDRKPVATASGLREMVAAASLEKGVLLHVQTPLGATNVVILKVGNE